METRMGGSSHASYEIIKVISLGIFKAQKEKDQLKFI